MKTIETRNAADLRIAARINRMFRIVGWMALAGLGYVALFVFAGLCGELIARLIP